MHTTKRLHGWNSVTYVNVLGFSMKKVKRIFFMFAYEIHKHTKLEYKVEHLPYNDAT